MFVMILMIGTHTPVMAQEGFTMKSAAEDPAFARRSFEHLLSGASPLLSKPVDVHSQRRLARTSFFTALHATRHDRVCEFQEIGFEYEPSAKGQAQMSAKSEDIRGLIDADVAPARMTLSNRYVVGPRDQATCGPSVTSMPIVADSAYEAWRGVTWLENFLAAPEGRKIDCLSRTCSLTEVSVAHLRAVHQALPGMYELSGQGVDQDSWRLTFGPGEKVTLFVGPTPQT